MQDLRLRRQFSRKGIAEWGWAVAVKYCDWTYHGASKFLPAMCDVPLPIYNQGQCFIRTVTKQTRGYTDRPDDCSVTQNTTK